MINQYSRIGHHNATNSRGSSRLRERPDTTMQWGSTKNVGYEMQNRQMMPSYREVKVRYLWYFEIWWWMIGLSLLDNNQLYCIGILDVKRIDSIWIRNRDGFFDYSRRLIIISIVIIIVTSKSLTASTNQSHTIQQSLNLTYLNYTFTILNNSLNE